MRIPAAAACALALVAVEASRAQRGMGDWMTTAYDAQRSSWVRSDGKISLESMRKPGFELVWKMKFDNAARGPNNISAPALIDFYIGYRGFRALGFFGGSSDRIIAVDTDLGRLEWTKNLASRQGPAPTAECPGGMTSAVTRPTATGYPPVPTGRGFGRGTPAKSAVGEPHEGAAILKDMPPPRPRPAPAPKPAAGEELNPFAPRVQYVAALTGDGKLHRVWVSNGNEPEPGIPFLPPNANARGLVVFGNTAYAATVGRCGGVDDAVWALDLASKKVNRWQPAGGKVAGTAGPAAGPDGKLYVAGGSELVALAPGTLETLATYKTEGAEFSSSPVVFEFKGRSLVAAAARDGRIHLLDAASLEKGALDRSEPRASSSFEPGSLTSWQDAAGTRWLLAAASGSVVAWKVVESDGKTSLEQGWTSAEMASPLPPIVVNGVVFAVSSGRNVPAVLYALDGATGKQVWSSGSTIGSFVHSGGLAAGGGRVYVSDHEGTQYAFGMPMEH